MPRKPLQPPARGRHLRRAVRHRVEARQLRQHKTCLHPMMTARVITTILRLRRPTHASIVVMTLAVIMLRKKMNHTRLHSVALNLTF